MPNQDTNSLPFKFNAEDSGIVSTNTVSAEALDDFLSQGEENQEEAPKPIVKPTPKPTETVKPEQEEVVVEEDNTNLVESVLGEDAPEETTETQEEEVIDENTEVAPKPFSENQYKGLSRDLFDLGVFSYGEDENAETVNISTPEALKERFDLEKRKGAGEAIEAFLGRLGPEYTEFFQSVFVDGIAPVDYLNSYTKVEGLKDLDLSDEANQERIMRQYYREEGRSTEYINDKIEKLKNYNDLESDAKETHAILLKKEETALQTKKQEKAQAEFQKQQSKQQYHTSVNKILLDKIAKKDFDGIPVDKKFAEDVARYITKESYKVGDETLTEFDKELLDLRNPANYEKKVKVAMLLKLLGTDPTLSKLAKKAISKETNQLFQSLEKKSKQAVVVNNPNNKKEIASNKWF